MSRILILRVRKLKPVNTEWMTFLTGGEKAGRGPIICPFVLYFQSDTFCCREKETPGNIKSQRQFYLQQLGVMILCGSLNISKILPTIVEKNVKARVRDLMSRNTWAGWQPSFPRPLYFPIVVIFLIFKTYQKHWQFPKVYTGVATFLHNI